MLTDDTLVTEIQNGNAAAMELLVKRHYNIIFSYICRKIGERNKADDLTQEVFIKMMKSIENLKVKEESLKIKEALSKIPDFQREVIILKFYHQKTYIEIAQITSCSESTVKSRARQGLSKLKEILKGSEIFDERLQWRKKVSDLKALRDVDRDIAFLIDEESAEVLKFLNSYTIIPPDEKRVNNTIIILGDYLPPKHLPDEKLSCHKLNIWERCKNILTYINK